MGVIIPFERIQERKEENMLKNIQCPICKNRKSCEIMGMGDSAIQNCGMFCTEEPPRRSNGDVIRAMTDEELAEYHTEMCGCPPGNDPIFCGMATIGCKGCWLAWLRKEPPKEES